jgi:hypothetical protein
MGKIGSKLAFLFAGFALAIATMAMAQSYDPDFGTGNVGYMVQPDGSTTRFGGKSAQINQHGDSAIMSRAQELPAGSILYKRGNKLYGLKNQMIDGKMCPEWEKDWTQ